LIDVSSMRRTALLAWAFLLAFSSPPFAGGEWPDGPYKQWFQNLLRPDNHLRPSGREQSLYCCGVADVVKTQFRVEAGDSQYPEDRWYAWLNEQWVLIPAEKIVQDHAPDGQPYLFMWSGSIQCFVRPKGGL
jgi:hypothetical protein